MAEKTVTINRLPVRTWNRLGVNETKLAVEAAEQNFSYSAAGEDRTICLRMTGDLDTAVNITLQADRGAKLRFVQVLAASEDRVLRSRITGTCTADSRIELVQVLAGKGDIYDDIQIDLTGNGSSLKTDIGYLAAEHQTLDINLVANHFGRKTKSEINANGALRDAAKKIFRGTIDFRNGSANSIGDEKETVLLLGEDVENKTVPLILCAEETVEGNHGATIGEPDEETLYYFASRGIGREAAEEMMARAAVLHVADLIEDPETASFARAAAGYDPDEER